MPTKNIKRHYQAHFDKFHSYPSQVLEDFIFQSHPHEDNHEEFIRSHPHKDDIILHISFIKEYPPFTIGLPHDHHIDLLNPKWYTELCGLLETSSIHVKDETCIQGFKREDFKKYECKCFTHSNHSHTKPYQIQPIFDCVNRNKHKLECWEWIVFQFKTITIDSISNKPETCYIENKTPFELFLKFKVFDRLYRPGNHIFDKFNVKNLKGLLHSYKICPSIQNLEEYYFEWVAIPVHYCYLTFKHEYPTSLVENEKEILKLIVTICCYSIKNYNEEQLKKPRVKNLRKHLIIIRSVFHDAMKNQYHLLPNHPDCTGLPYFFDELAAEIGFASKNLNSSNMKKSEGSLDNLAISIVKMTEDFIWSLGKTVIDTVDTEWFQYGITPTHYNYEAKKKMDSLLDLKKWREEKKTVILCNSQTDEMIVVVHFKIQRVPRCILHVIDCMLVDEIDPLERKLKIIKTGKFVDFYEYWDKQRDIHFLLY